MEGEEIFAAWHFARCVAELVRRGKAEYPLPMFVNAALNRPGRRPGQYPSAAPLPHLIDVYQAAAPTLDMLCPDIYFYNFADWTEPYRRPGHPLFVPEATRTVRAAANAMYAIAQQDAIGFSPFGIELIFQREGDLLAQAYGALRHLAPRVLEGQGKRKSFGLLPKINYDGSVGDEPQQITLGRYELTARFNGVPRPPADPATLAIPNPAMRGADLPGSGGMILMTGDDEYTLVGTGLTVTHASRESHMRAGLLDVQEWTPGGDGQWQFHRWLNGDETDGGRRLFLPNDRVGMLRVRLYQYR